MFFSWATVNFQVLFPPCLFFPSSSLSISGFWVFSFCLCVICFLNLPLNSLFDSVLCASCKKHFVFISRQHLTISFVLPACHHTPCQSRHNKSERNKCLACQCIFHFLLSRLQGLILIQTSVTGNPKEGFFHTRHSILPPLKLFSK